MKQTLYQELKKKHYTMFVGVPCSNLKDVIAAFQNDPAILSIPATKEDTAVAIAFGAALAGKKPLVYMQNSGLGNVVNVVTSLLHVYKVSIDFLVSDRERPLEHVYMHKITKKLIKILEYKNYVRLVKQKI